LLTYSLLSALMTSRWL